MQRAEQVIPLEGRSERLAKGDEVLAVYVDTTSFYHATIAIPPRGRGANIVSAANQSRHDLLLVTVISVQVLYPKCAGGSEPHENLGP